MLGNAFFVPLLGSVVLNTLGQFCAKMGASGLVPSSFFGYITQVVTTPFLLFSMACYGMSLFLWIMVLSKCEISVAASLFSVSYLLTVLMGVVIFKEPASCVRMVGFLMIMGGIYLVSSRA